MDADVTSQRQAFRLGCAHQLYAQPAGQSRQVNPRASVAHQRDYRGNRHCFRAHRNAGEAEARRDFTIVRNAAAREMRIFGPQPNG